MADDSGQAWSSPASRLRWDVFLNFRGKDTRNHFVIPLHAELQKNDVRAFFDDGGLKQGDSLDPILFEAIEDSGAAITIISPAYASSWWCLEELARICECRRLILPVFYCVNPSDVRKQKGPFEAHFRMHEEKFGEKMVMKWRKAMKIVGGLKGQVFDESHDEAILIRSLVKNILNELSNRPQFVAQYIVGLSWPEEELIRLLDLNSKGKVLVLGLHGMGGIGKTTLAKSVYNKLVRRFQHRSFISNVREMSSKEGGSVFLQNKLLEDLSGGMLPPVNDQKAGKRAIKEELAKNPVLIVLDDVDSVNQLRTLAGKRDWFHEGSRIIICTRDGQILSAALVDEMYEVKELGAFDSLKLFSYHAFGKEKPTDKFSSLCMEIVSLTGRLPLALKVFGSFLSGITSVDKWEDAVKKLKRIHPGDLHDVLKISFEGLDKEEKDIFLDIACLFLELEMSIDDAIDVIDGSGLSAKSTMDILIQRSLIKVTEDNKLGMHDQIRDMGRQIVLDENHVDAGMRSRLWDHGEILSVLEDGKGTGSIRGIVLNTQNKNILRFKTAREIAWNNIRRTPSLASAVTYLKEMCRQYFQHSTEEQGEKLIHTRTKPFDSMSNLRLLQLSNVKLEGDFKYLPAKLKWLQWRKCPLTNLPSKFPRDLAVLDLPESNIKRLWGSRWWCWWYNNKVADNLKIMNLNGCYNLTYIPDMSGHPALKKLNLGGCRSLANIHNSIGDLTALRHLNLEDCSELGEFPRDVSGLKNLETFNLSGCLQLKNLPDDMSSMKSLKELIIVRAAIRNLPDSIIRLTRLERLNLHGCKSLSRLPVGIGTLGSLRELFLDDTSLEEVPHSIGSLKNLEKLSLMHCTLLTAIPDAVGNLKSLTEFWLNRSSVIALPASIGSIHYLKSLSVGYCRGMTTLPVSIGRLASIVDLELDGTSIRDLPDQIGGLKSLRTLQMRNCESLVSLPETIGRLLALETLRIPNAGITKLPESIGLLENLSMLNLNKCKLLCRLPASIGELKSLRNLLMEKTAVSELPETFGMLSNLMILKMSKMPWHEVPHSQSSEPMVIELPSTFSNLSLLKEFEAKAWRISGKIHDDFEKLSLLETLNLSHNNFYSLPSSLKGLTILRELFLEHCKELRVLPPLPSSLVKVNAANCVALETVTDLSNLEILKELNLTNCGKLLDIPGLECLKSLIWLYMIGCNSCASDVKEKLSKAFVKNLYGLSMPGSIVPDWFTSDVISFSSRRNYVVKAVIVVVVISVNHQIEDDMRDQLPVLPDIEAKIIRVDKVIFSTVLSIGVPKTDEDQVYLCRYPKDRQLVSILEDGDQIKVAMRNPPYVRGVELKKTGIHLVFENDDDYDGDEDLLHESNKSASERLTNFIRSSDERGHMTETIRNQDRVCCLSALKCFFGF